MAQSNCVWQNITTIEILDTFSLQDFVRPLDALLWPKLEFCILAPISRF